ncbi:restriction endonuclease subunit S [Pseudomonas sp. GW531-T4]|uniref:restriction endonuclease subunit S n=1 Tax=Pseudomonas sp. GW531-T4 TaxID=2075553 RepID=UPI000CD0F837|nr:restriction endonuclease subunit S [Pseudomonas sp. GW531-T4]POA62820.1 restriction endonuclease subunit S [Pseudomonas sp. GW531-T4]
MSFPAYPAYKDSGVEWLGVVPDHWAVTLLKRGYEVVLGKMLQPEARRDGDEFLPYLRAANIQLSGVDTVDVKRMWFGAEEKKSLLLRRGDLLVSEGGDVGRSAIWEFDEEECYFQNSINRIRSIDGNNTRFLYFWMIAIKKNGYVDMLCNKSTIAHFTAEKVAAVPLPIPTKSEQAQIARFLDHETTRIDALIEEQQRLIELLKEKRQAVISHAVTKGLDPTAPMKDSGVEWLGEVPTHWDVARVKNIAKLESGHTPSKEYPEYWEGGDIPWVSLNDSKQLKVVDYINETQYMITALGMNNSSARLLPARAVVFTRDATIGLAAITTRKMCVSQHLIAWICIETLMLPEYLLLVFYAMEEELGRFTFGATLKTIGMPDVRKLTTTVPPLTEQAEIVAEVNSKRDLISRLISEGENGIALLQERRSALISAAVTGKIDVRGWQPPVSVPSPELTQEAV